MKIKDVTAFLESLFPPAIQESYDNSGLLTGHEGDQLNGVLVCLNVTQDVLNEAIDKKCNLIISHHPLIFSCLKKITGNTPTERYIEFLIENRIALYSIHTNADKQVPGLNTFVAEKMGLSEIRVLSPEIGNLRKLITFCPESYADAVRQALFDAGAGKIGEYDMCSFNTNGMGTFRGSENSSPFAGTPSKYHVENEQKIETIFPFYKQRQILSALLKSHPYEEVAYDIFKLENENPVCGLGAIGYLSKPMVAIEFLKFLKSFFKISIIKYSGHINHTISKVAFCGGSGASLTKVAHSSEADAFVTSDIKYHDFDHGKENFLLADVGHYESELFFKEYIVSLLTKKITNFAIHFAENEKDHVIYF